MTTQAQTGVISTSTSSFNWWPYPAGGVSTSISTSPTPSSSLLVAPTTEAFSPTSTSISTSSASHPSISETTTISSHSSVPSLIQITALTSIPVSSPSSGPPSPYKPRPTQLNPLWLIPICLLAGAVLGAAVGFFAWRCFGAKRAKMNADGIPEGYACAYDHDKDVDKFDVDEDVDVERGRGREYAYLGRRPTLDVGHATRRVPSNASASGARTRMEGPQARKRSGAVGAAHAGAIDVGIHENTNHVKSSLLSTLSPAGVVDLSSKPLPLSPVTSHYLFGDGEDCVDDGVRYDTIRHKSVRRRIWERLGFAEEDIGRKKSIEHDGEGRHTWSAGKREEPDVGVGRSLSLWGRRKSMKEGRVERWIRGVRGDHEEDEPERIVLQQQVTDSMDCERTPLQQGTPELVLNALRCVTPTTRHSHGSDDDVGFDTKPPYPYSSVSHEAVPPVKNKQPSTIRAGQRTSIRKVEQRPRGVSLQDPGPILRTGNTSLQNTSKQRTSTSKKAFSLRSPPSVSSAGAALSPEGLASHMPQSPSSVSRYSATPHTPALPTLYRSPTRTPTRPTPSKDFQTSLTRAAPSRLARPISNMTSRNYDSSRDICTPVNNTVQTVLQHHPSSSLPAGPSSVTSPPLQSALCFDATPTPSASPGITAASRVSRSKPSTSRASGRSSVRPSVSSALSRPPSHSPTVTNSRPLSPKERYLARQTATARVDMILTRSYSSRNFEEIPVSPTMFGAVINEDVGELGLDEGDVATFQAEGDGIEQRLDRLRMREGGMY